MRPAQLARSVTVALPLLSLHYARTAAEERIYLAPDDHTDYMWTLDEAGYAAAFVEMLDYYLDQIDRTAGAPPDHQARWNCDGSFWLYTYEKRRGRTAMDRLMARVRDGHISAPLTTLAVTFGAQPAEAVLRGMYYAGALERRYGVRFPLALAMENQTLPYGLGALWAGAGAAYSWRGICNCATRVRGADRRDHEIYRWVGPDGSTILMRWQSLFTGDNRHIGGYAEARGPAQVVRFLRHDTAFRARWPYPVKAAFGQGWDDPKTMSDEILRTARDLSGPGRRVIVSNQVDFFRDFERSHGAGLPRQGLAFGNEWDTYSASLVEVTAGVRRAVERLRGAEALAALVSRVRPGFFDEGGRRAAREQAMVAVGLYYEHNWTGDGKVDRQARAAWQRRLLATIDSYVDGLLSDSAAALSELIPRGPRARFWVANPLGFPRTDVADLPYAGPLPAHAVELPGGAPVPSQPITVGGKRRLRILATEVPPVGYKVYEVRAGAGPRLPDAAAATPARGLLASDRYRLTVSPGGALRGLRDLRSGREFIDVEAGGRANELGPGAAAGGQLVVESAGPVSVTLRATTAQPLRHTTRITLYRGLDRIDLANEIEQNFTDVRTWDFSFRLARPQVWHEEVGAVIPARTVKDGGPYADRAARYDWLTLNHFADLGSAADGAGVTLSSADLSFMRVGDSTPERLDTATPRLRVLAGGQVDGPDLGVPAQGGDTRFTQRFALRTYDRGFDAPAAMRFALMHQNPLISGAVSGGGEAPWPAAADSLLEVSDPRVLLWAVKPAEDAPRTLIVRLWSLAREELPVTLRVRRPLRRAFRVSHIETPLGELPRPQGRECPLRLRPQQLVTVALELE